MSFIQKNFTKIIHSNFMLLYSYIFNLYYYQRTLTKMKSQHYASNSYENQHYNTIGQRLQTSQYNSSNIIERLFPEKHQKQEVVVMTLNDTRRSIKRIPQRQFARSSSESKLFNQSLKKIEVKHEEKLQRSINRTYKNESTINIFTQDTKPFQFVKGGVKKIKLSPPKSERASRKKRLELPKKTQQNNNQLRYLVPKVDISTKQKQIKKSEIFISLGKTNQPSKINQIKPNATPIICEKKHFQNKQKDCLNQILNQSNKTNITSDINFNSEYFKKKKDNTQSTKSNHLYSNTSTTQDCHKENKSSIVHSQLSNLTKAERLALRFKH